MESTAINPTMPPPEYLTTDDICKRFKCCRQSVYRMVSRGEIQPAVKVGRRLRFDPNNLTGSATDTATASSN